MKYPTGIKLTFNDLYHGLYIQSASNAEYIYQVNRVDNTDSDKDSYGVKITGDYYLICSHMITRNGTVILYNEYKAYSLKDVELLKTHLTEQLNREYKLNNLIEI